MTAEEQMRQAGMTAHTYLLDGIRAIDEKLGAGYAAAHPELLGAFMQTAASDFMACWLGGRIDGLSNAVSDVAGGLAQNEP